MKEYMQEILDQQVSIIIYCNKKKIKFVFFLTFLCHTEVLHFFFRSVCLFGYLLRNHLYHSRRKDRSDADHIKRKKCLRTRAKCTDADSCRACADSHPGSYFPLIHSIIFNGSVSGE